MMPKFRAWDKELKMMFDVKSLIYTLHIATIASRYDIVPNRKRSFKDIILMQLAYEDENYIIYDKDIVKDTNSGENGLVIYDKDDCAWKVRTETTEEYLNNWIGCDVIGNMYENHKLLER